MGRTTVAPARCPYCWKSWRGKDARLNLRIHVGANACGQVPPQVAVEFAPDDPAGEDTELLPLVTKVAEAHGWVVNHVFRTRGRDGRWLTPTTASGFPDLWILRPPQLIVLELKARRHRLEPGQADWIDGLATVPGIISRFAGPDDWPEIQHILKTPLDPERQP